VTDPFAVTFIPATPAIFPRLVPPTLALLLVLLLMPGIPGMLPLEVVATPDSLWRDTRYHAVPTTSTVTIPATAMRIVRLRPWWDSSFIGVIEPPQHLLFVGVRRLPLRNQ